MKTGSWSKIWKKLPNYDPTITDSSFRLKKNYEKFLLEYENIYFANYKSKGISESLRNLHSHKEESVNNNDKESIVITNDTNSSDEASLDYENQKSQKLPASLDIPQLPMNIDNLTLIDIGHVIPKYPFIDGNNIWPLYYRCASVYIDIDDTSKDSLYINTINTDKNNNIIFEVYVQDKPDRVFIGSSPEECWNQIDLCIISNLQREYKYSPSCRPNGIQMFGLDHPTIRGFLIKQLKKFSSNNSEKVARKRRYNKRKRFDPSLTREWKRSKDLKYCYNETYRMDYDPSFELTSNSPTNNSFDGDICYINDYFTSTKMNKNQYPITHIHQIKEIYPPLYDPQVYHYHGKDDYTKEYFSQYNFEFSQRGSFMFQNY